MEMCTEVVQIRGELLSSDVLEVEVCVCVCEMKMTLLCGARAKSL